MDRRMFLNSVAAATLATTAGAAKAQVPTRPKVLPVPDVTGLPDYSYAGYGFGLTPLPVFAGTVIDVATFGAKGDGVSDDTQAVLRALAAAHATAGKVTLRFPAGRFVLTAVLRIERSDMVLEGAGRGDSGTVLYFPRPLRLVDEGDGLNELREYIRKENKRQVEEDRNIDYWFSEYSWSEGFIRVGIPGVRYAGYLPQYDPAPDVITRGVAGRQWTTRLDVADGSSIVPGQVVQVQWRSDKGRASGLIRSIYGDTDLPIGERLYENPARPIVIQTTRVLARDGNRLTLGDPLLHDVAADIPAEVVRKEVLTNVGIQGLRIEFPDAPAFGHHLEDGYNAIALHEMFDGWVRDVAIHNADSAVLTYDSASLTLTDILTTGERAAHYAVHIGNAHNVLVRNVIVANPVIHPLSVNTQATRAVYTGAQVLRDGLIDQHAGANHANLFDNVELHITPRRDGDQWVHDLWNGGGAGYWKPNHGLHNTTWNLRVHVTGGPDFGETVALRGLKQGVGENVLGVSGNRVFTVEYPRAARIEGVNATWAGAPSLYDYQLARRKAG